jgi:hypothetical protein
MVVLCERGTLAGEVEMTFVEQAGVRAQITQTLNTYHRAMVDARIDVLDGLLDREFALVHITGYNQPKDEWFGVLRSGQFDYHKIDVDEETVTVSIQRESAELTGRGIFNATINGAKNPWRLQFTVGFVRRGDRWIIKNARYTTY